MFDALFPHRRTMVGRRVARATPLVAVAALATALATPSALASPAPAQPTPPAGAAAARDDPATPPPGMTWIEGVITDQAAHGQDDVNVEAWASIPADPATTAPVASALSYGGSPTDPTIQHGFFLLEVPSDQAYRITFSAVGGREDGDPFRMRRYGEGRPLMVRPAARAGGRIRDLGTIALARQGTVASSIRLTLARPRVAVSDRARVKVTVSSPYVTDVAGRLIVRVARHHVADHLSRLDHGRTSLRLPRLRHAGTYRVHARFLGSSTVKHSSAKVVRLHVRGRR